jgi:hypothetical protein
LLGLPVGLSGYDALNPQSYRDANGDGHERGHHGWPELRPERTGSRNDHAETLGPPGRQPLDAHAARPALPPRPTNRVPPVVPFSDDHHHPAHRRGHVHRGALDEAGKAARPGAALSAELWERTRTLNATSADQLGLTDAASGETQQRAHRGFRGMDGQLLGAQARLGPGGRGLRGRLWPSGPFSGTGGVSQRCDGVRAGRGRPSRRV